MIKKIVKYLGLSLAVMATLFLIACQTALTIALADILPAANLFLDVADPAAAAAAGPYLAQLNVAVDCALAEYKSADSGAEKKDKIAVCFLTVVKPDLPPGTAANVLNALLQVNTLVQTYLDAAASMAAVIQSTPASALAFHAKGPHALKLTKSDLKRLPKIAAANDAFKARLKAKGLIK